MTETISIFFIKKTMYAYIDFWSMLDKDYYSMFFLIDTGAETTTFSHSALKTLGYNINESDTITLRTGGGETEAYNIRIPKMKIGSIELSYVKATSNTFLDSFEIDGILGMNVLSQFNFSFNLDKNLMTLEEREYSEDYTILSL